MKEKIFQKIQVIFLVTIIIIIGTCFVWYVTSEGTRQAEIKNHALNDSFKVIIGNRMFIMNQTGILYNGSFYPYDHVFEHKGQG